MFSRVLVAVALVALGVVAQSGDEKPFALQTPGEFVQVSLGIVFALMFVALTSRL